MVRVGSPFALRLSTCETSTHSVARRLDSGSLDTKILIQLLLGRNSPLVSEGFFGRSENPLPSILSFFSAALGVEESIAGVSEKGKHTKGAVNAGQVEHTQRATLKEGSVNLG